MDVQAVSTAVWVRGCTGEGPPGSRREYPMGERLSCSSRV